MPIPFLSRESPNLAIVDWCLIASQEVSVGECVIGITLRLLLAPWDRREVSMEQFSTLVALCRFSVESTKGKDKHSGT